MYIITEWLERYEVNDKGQPARLGDKLRVRRLEYIRSKLHGRSRSAGFAAMQRRAGEEKAYEVFGIFQKLLEIAGDEVGGKRGVLLNARGNPATPRDLALILSATEESVEFALQVLVDPEVGWIQEVNSLEFQENQENPGDLGEVKTTDSLKFLENQEKSGGNGKQDENAIISSKTNIPGNSRKFLENQEKSGGLYNETKRNETERNETQRNETGQENPGEGQNSQVTHKGVVYDLGNFNSSSFSLRLVSIIEHILNVRSKPDRSAIRNLGNWLILQVLAKKFDEEIYQRVVDIAKESKSGRNPRAVFFSRLDEEIGYRPKVIKEKLK